MAAERANPAEQSEQTRPGKGRAAHLELGRKGEDLAAAFLRQRKLKLLERNWRPAGLKAAALRGLELDIVAQEGDCLVFVEVKTRRTPAHSPFAAHQAYTAAKQEKLRKAVALYLEQKRAWNAPCRFDLICVTFPLPGAADSEQARLDYFKNVLDSGGYAF